MISTYQMERTPKISQIINKWVFDRQTPDGNEGVKIEIPYLECAYSTMHTTSLTQLVVILVQSIAIESNQWISLAMFQAI